MDMRMEAVTAYSRTNSGMSVENNTAKSGRVLMKTEAET